MARACYMWRRKSAVGGPLALVEDGDTIVLDIPERKLHLDVSNDALAERRTAWVPPKPHYTRGYGHLYLEHVTQANLGCDFDFLHAGEPTPEPEIH